MISSGSPSRVQNDRKAKSSPAGAPIGVLSKVLPRWGSSCWPCPPWPRALLLQMIQGTCFFLGAGLGLLSTPQVQLAVQPAVSAHRGAPLQQMSALPGPRRSSAALRSGPATPGTEMSSGSRGTQQERGTHSTTILPSPQSQPAGPKQPPQERAKGKSTSDRDLAPLPRAFPPYLQIHSHAGSLRDANARPLTHAHARTRADAGARCPDPQTLGRMLGYAHQRTHMLSFDTNLAGELATTWGGEKEQRRQGCQSMVLPGALSAGTILRLALMEAAPALTGAGGGEEC